MKTNKENAQHYTWGDNCQGWRLHDFPDLSVIEEVMPPQTQELSHYHKVATQFFYILEGTAIIRLEGIDTEVTAENGFHIPPGKIHNIFNRTDKLLKFIVISKPATRNDRIETPG